MTLPLNKLQCIGDFPYYIDNFAGVGTLSKLDGDTIVEKFSDALTPGRRPCGICTGAVEVGISE